MPGLHLLADLSGCPAHRPEMTDPVALRLGCLAAAREAGLTVVGDCFHAFPPEHGEPRGVTGVLLLAESHLAVHTWPERGAVTVDLYVCHQRGEQRDRAHTALACLQAMFAPDAAQVQAVQRLL